MAAQHVEPLYLFPPKSGADPGFPVGGGTDPPWGRQYMILSKFQKNCMESRKFWARGGYVPGRPLRSTIEDDKFYFRGRCFNPSGVGIPWENLAASLAFSLFGGFDEKV